jgi:2-C-methyl-D-erythritol 4-phosphate cytidylyltransferase
VAAGTDARADIVLVLTHGRFVCQRSWRVVAGAQRHGAVIPALPIVDALKRVADGCISGAAQQTGLVAPEPRRQPGATCC